MYKLTTGGLGYIRRGLGDLPGFQDMTSRTGGPPYVAIPMDQDSASRAISNIGEGIWNVLGNLLYLMNTDPNAMAPNGPSSREAVEGYFAQQVSPADVLSGNAVKINAAANATARHFLNMNGGPRAATGVAPGDYMGSCLAYSVGSSSFYAAQTQTSGSWSPQTKCAQLKALMNGSGLNFLQVALGGDGLGNMPSASQSSSPVIGAGDGNPIFFDPQTGQQIGAGGSGPSPVYQQPLLSSQPVVRVNSDPVLPPSLSPAVQPIVQVFRPQNSPSAVSTPASPLAMVPAASPYNANQVYPQTAPVSSGVVPSSSAASSPASSSPLSGITDWITANPLLAAGIAAAGLFMFSKGGRR